MKKLHVASYSGRHPLGLCDKPKESLRRQEAIRGVGYSDYFICRSKEVWCSDLSYPSVLQPYIWPQENLYSVVLTCFLLYPILVYATQVNWLASSEVISQILFTSEQPKKYKMAFVGILSQIKLLFDPLDIQLMWYILKQLFTSVSVKVGDIISLNMSG